MTGLITATQSNNYCQANLQAGASNAGILHLKANQASYKIKPGDTLSRIAKQHGLSTDRLHRMNRDIVNNPHCLGTGKYIRVPKRFELKELPKIKIPEDFLKQFEEIQRFKILSDT